MSDNENITYRKKNNIQKSHSMDNMNDSLDSNSSNEFLLRRSLDLSTAYNSSTHEMKEEIQNLRLQLMSTQSEMKKIILEKNELQKQMNMLQIEIDVLKKLCNSPISSLQNNDLSNSKKKARRRLTNSFQTSPLTLNCCENIIPKSSDTQPKPTEGKQVELTSGTAHLLRTEQQKSPLLEPEQHTVSIQPTSSNSASRQEPAAAAAVVSATATPNTPTIPARLFDKKKETKITDSGTINKKAFIFGSSQCTGLVSNMLKTRLHNRYEKYQFMSITKPNAETKEILNSAKMFDISPEDRVILCVGQHDNNPYDILAELSIFVKNTKCQILVLQVFNSDHLNETKLNTMLKFICNQNKNCTYVEYDFTQYYNNSYLLCGKINSILDQLDYDSKFLSFKFKTHARRDIRKSFQNKTYLKNDNNIYSFYYESQKKYKPTLVDSYTQTDDTSDGTMIPTTSADKNLSLVLNKSLSCPKKFFRSKSI